METYARKPDIFHCIQYTGDNREKIIDALKIPKEDCQCWVNEDTKENYLVIKGISDRVQPKAWVMLGADKSVNTVDPDLFGSTYQQIWIKE